MVPTRVAAQFPQYVLGQDVFERILRRRRAFATQSISDKSLASDSYELRHANPMLQKKHHFTIRPSTVTKSGCKELSELVLYFGRFESVGMYPNTVMGAATPRQPRRKAGFV